MRRVSCRSLRVLQASLDFDPHEFGDGLKQKIDNEAGDFIYIKPGVPHEVFNLSDTEPVVAFVARSSADEWDKIIPYDRNAPRS